MENFYTNVRTNKLELLPEFEFIPSTQPWYFISYFCPDKYILFRFSGSDKNDFAP